MLPSASPAHSAGYDVSDVTQVTPVAGEKSLYNGRILQGKEKRF
jgi:hypothetical protein